MVAQGAVKHDVPASSMAHTGLYSRVQILDRGSTQLTSCSETTWTALKSGLVGDAQAFK
ncbi:hypothetical protein GP2143_03818 [marine gamma proteobacterium HTCC2143]|uniref:Uncharacterized protein n=1 Tax=marine gamma proteobacterium HTCC2143 TaxID=247633 RepID=A0YDB5_9GAMM|nr:hypothetical protein GP2143_03818 [marine gamma proteobacterium HTCC2143]